MPRNGSQMPQVARVSCEMDHYYCKLVIPVSGLPVTFNGMDIH